MPCRSDVWSSAPSFQHHLLRGLTLALVALSLSGCGYESRVAAGNEAGILHAALAAEPQTLDPHVASGAQEYTLITTLNEPLVSIDPADLSIVPAAAESWSFDPDGRGATFRLREAGRWSNGDPVTAGDFVFAWRRAVNPKLGNQVAEVFFPLRNAERIYRAELKDVTRLGVRAVDDLTLRLELEFPLPEESLLLNLAHPSAVPLHEGLVRAHGGEASRYAGWAKAGRYVSNGPFQLDRWRIQRDLTVLPNPEYWDADAVALKGIVFHPVTSVTTQEKLFRSGQLHMTSGLPSSKISLYRDAEVTPLVDQPIFRSTYFAVNLHRSALSDVRVRRALALAVDREALARPVFNGAATPVGRYLPPGLPGYDPPRNAISFDPAEARRLLAEAGYPGGKGFPPIELLAVSGEQGRALSTAVQQMWRDVLNISVSAVNQEWQVYLNSLVGGEFDVVLASWTGGTTPSGFLDRWITGGGTNDSRFSHATFDRLIKEDSRNTMDHSELMRIYREAEEIILTDLPVIPLFQTHMTFLKQPCVDGVPANAGGLVDFKYASLANQPAWEMPERELALEEAAIRSN